MLIYGIEHRLKNRFRRRQRGTQQKALEKLRLSELRLEVALAAVTRRVVVVICAPPSHERACQPLERSNSGGLGRDRAEDRQDPHVGFRAKPSSRVQRLDGVLRDSTLFEEPLPNEGRNLCFDLLDLSARPLAALGVVGVGGDPRERSKPVTWFAIRRRERRGTPRPSSLRGWALPVRASAACCTSLASVATARTHRSVNDRSTPDRSHPIPAAAYVRTSSFACVKARIRT